MCIRLPLDFCSRARLFIRSSFPRSCFKALIRLSCLFVYRLIFVQELICSFDHSSPRSCLKALIRFFVCSFNRSVITEIQSALQILRKDAFKDKPWDRNLSSKRPSVKWKNRNCGEIKWCNEVQPQIQPSNNFRAQVVTPPPSHTSPTAKVELP